MDIKSLLFTPYDKPNADGDYVENTTTANNI